MGLPLTNCGIGECFGMPDVCKTPIAGIPVPIPYPNIGENIMSDPATAAITVIVDGFPGAVELTQIMMTQGDDAGLEGGLVSETVMGPAEMMLGSANVLLMGRGAAYLCSMTGHNGEGIENMPAGLQTVPSQATVLVAP